MNAVTLEYPDVWLAPLGTDAEHFAQEAKLAAAMKLFEKGRFTSGHMTAGDRPLGVSLCRVSDNGR